MALPFGILKAGVRQLMQDSDFRCERLRGKELKMKRPLIVRSIGALWAMTCFAILAVSAGVSAQETPQIEASWSQITGVPAAGSSPSEAAPLNIRMRFAVAAGAAPCGDFQVIVRGVLQDLRWGTRSSRVLDDVIVCDAPMAFNWPEAKLVLRDGSAARMAGSEADVVFPGPAAVGRRQLAQTRGDLISVAMFGDSGCNGALNPRSPQDCSDPAAWVFPRLIEDAAQPGALPDFALHLGNMRFDRPEDPSWDRWKAEFFTPAQPLLAQVPFAFARGSQEACRNREAGYGWFLLFGGSGADGGASTCADRSGRMPVWYFDIVVRSSLDAGTPQRIVVVDSSAHPDRKLTEHFEEALGVAWAPEHPTTWLVTHRPIWGLDTFSGFMQQQSDPDVVSGFARAIKAMPDGGCKPFVAKDCRLTAVLSGHQHAFENVVFPSSEGSALPQQVVIGMSGVKLPQAEPNEIFRFDAAGMRGRSERDLCGAVANWESAYGYVRLESGVRRDETGLAGWRGEARLIGEEGVLAPVALIGAAEAPDASGC